eukprot:Seg4665.2 transcript_id=Seg4665.2/GoldUCD/mRNA.D3Y31 product="hypothetical protein" protein_id=Seg4665.2/GoldUCD/D3Y31
MMFQYENITLDNGYKGDISTKFLAITNRRERPKQKHRTLEKGILTNLIRFAKIRKQDQDTETPANYHRNSIKPIRNIRKCSRWFQSDHDVPQGSHPGTLQPYCEILGSLLCSDCSLERTKTNNLLHLPAIFGQGNEHEYQGTFIGRQMHSKDTAKPMHRGIQVLREGSIARANTPSTPTWCDFSPFLEKRDGVYTRSEIKRLSTLPRLLREQKYELKRFQEHQLKRRRPVITRPDLSIIAPRVLNSSVSFSSSIGRELAKMNPVKLIEMKKLRVPYNTPYPDEDIDERRQRKVLDVIKLAQKLKALYELRYLPPDSFYQNVVDEDDVEESFLFLSLDDEDEGVDHNDDRFLPGIKFATTDDSPYLNEDDLTFRHLMVSPPKVDVLTATRIREDSNLEF